MAKINEIQDAIATIEASIDQLQNAEYVSEGTYRVNGETYSLKQLRDQESKLRKQVSSLKKVYEPYTKLLNETKSAEEQLASAQRLLTSPELALSGLTKEQARAEVRKLSSKVTQLKTQTRKALDKDYAVSTEVSQISGLEATRLQGPAMGPGPFTPEELAQMRAGQETKTTAGATTGTGVGGGGGVPLTPQERKQQRAGRQAQRFEKAAAELRKMAPQYAWILDIDQTKYPDVRKLLQRATRDGMFESPEGIQRFIGELNGTSFFTELRDKGTKQKIVNLVGDLGFDDANLGKLLANASNLQWDDETLNLEVYKEAFRRNADGTYVHDQAEKRARKSTDYLRVQNIGTAFFNRLDDATVENVLTGSMIEDDVLRQQRELAKSKYGHLTNLIDQGLTMDAITQSYRDEAARLLERDPNDVNMGEALYQTAYDFTDESGQKRLMTTGEWVRQIRSDAAYGWDKTENAKQEARQLASSIVQSFGRVM